MMSFRSSDIKVHNSSFSVGGASRVGAQLR
jgi:hypothetical protein